MKNKIKYKVVSKEPLISKDEIEKMKDFDKILAGSANYPVVNTGILNAKYLSKIVTIIGILVLTYAIYEFNNESISENDFATNANLITSNSIKDSEKTDLVLVDDTKDEVIVDEKIILTSDDNANKILKNKITPKKKTENHRIKKDSKTIKDQSFMVDSKKDSVSATDSTMNKKVKEIAKSVIVKAKPKNGYANLYAYFNKVLDDPEGKRTSNKEGTVMVSFVIGINGEVKNVKVENSIDPELDLEAIKITKNMPEWNPATRDNIPVESKLKIPITFKVVIKKSSANNN